MLQVDLLLLLLACAVLYAAVYNLRERKRLYYNNLLYNKLQEPVDFENHKIIIDSTGSDVDHGAVSSTYGDL